jgi:peptidoglycan/LPS O-acetylase OafA/YrhL
MPDDTAARSNRAMTDAAVPAAGMASPARSRHDRATFYTSLESVRGLAALAVGVFHSLFFLKIGGAAVVPVTFRSGGSWELIAARILLTPFNGHAAVSLFFVLSGFVLAMSLARDSRPLGSRAFSFGVRRFLRIYPALFVCVVVTALALWTARRLGSGLPFAHLGIRTVIDNLLLLDFGVNGATWTLWVELVAIPFIFAVHLLTRRFGTPALWLVIVLAVVALFWPVRSMSGRHLHLFFVGMLAAQIGRAAMARVRPRAARYGFAAAAVGLVSARPLVGAAPWSLLLEGLASAVIICVLAFAKRSSAHRVLETAPLRFLGRISYSFYLYHPTALVLVLAPFYFSVPPAETNTRDLALLLAATATIPLAIAFGYASYRFVEQPMIRLGRRV